MRSILKDSEREPCQGSGAQSQREAKTQFQDLGLKSTFRWVNKDVAEVLSPQMTGLEQQVSSILGLGSDFLVPSCLPQTDDDLREDEENARGTSQGTSKPSQNAPAGQSALERNFFLPCQ